MQNALTEANQCFEDEVQYQSLLASFVGELHDVRGLVPVPDYLGGYLRCAYPKGQLLAHKLLDAYKSQHIRQNSRNVMRFSASAVSDLTPTGSAVSN